MTGKRKFLSLLMAVALVTAPTAAMAEGTTTPDTTTQPGDTTTEPGDGTTEPGDGTVEPGDGTTPPAEELICPPKEDGDDEDEDEEDGEDEGEDDTTEPGDGTTEPGDGTTEPGDGTTEPGDGTTEPGDGTTEPGDGTTEPGDGTTTEPGTSTLKASKGHGHGKGKDSKDSKGHGKGDVKKGKPSKSDCWIDKGKHKGWSNKIMNMLKHLEELQDEMEDLQAQLDRLMYWAKTQGSASDVEALNAILEALGAKDEVGEATPEDLIVLAETQDRLNNTDGAVATLEKALVADYTNDKVYAELSKKLAKKGDKSIKVYVKGTKPAFDVKPTIVNNRTVVPVRAIAESLKVDVQFDAATGQITLTDAAGKVVTLTLGNTTATVDGQPITLDVPAQIIGNRTVVPLRALGELFGLNVGWDATSSMATLK
ncbi:stalk domain-containing protein [Tumebacillus sp. DT12]|uniref:Stalk domain-containing protein n=1 Tax=Tumebacillus lacus TaxID=2995335 RepID=A0ABT3X0H2_9BACL|nr:stalk domain-containing protein [Tumebacillus lacus]MCX7569502.1 stalk domain-containing protein [Tumebacillus lacus]